MISPETGQPVEPTQAPSSSFIPKQAVPWITAIVGLAATGFVTLPEHTVAYKVCAVLVALGSVLGIASPGLHR